MWPSVQFRTQGPVLDCKCNVCQSNQRRRPLAELRSSPTGHVNAPVGAKEHWQNRLFGQHVRLANRCSLLGSDGVVRSNDLSKRRRKCISHTSDYTQCSVGEFSGTFGGPIRIVLQESA